MSDAPSLRSLFLRDPTRPLEEVQKVNATEEAKRDVEEFCETDSARRVLERLSEIVARDARLPDPRFLYLHATFGSGKTHLLKLIGYATGQAEIPDAVVSELSTRFEGFRTLRAAMDGAPADRFVPVFLNLLNRDASKEPPIPILIYEAIGRRLGYPTDPRWLIEFLLRLEEKSPGARVWTQLAEYEGQNGTLLNDEGQILEMRRGDIRTWLYQAVPVVMKSFGVACTRSDVEHWVAQAEANIAEETFRPKALRDRIKTVQDLLSERSGQATELLIGLDEIALFIGDDRSRYDELRATMQVLLEDPNPIVLGTGQWGLNEVHSDFVGTPNPSAWYSQEVKLEGADTEVIVQARWLQKKGDVKSQIRATLQSMPAPPKSLNGSVSSATDAVAAYPFRPRDLHYVREAMQSLLTRDRVAATEHIQGRALLVLVRSLFVRQHWADAQHLGAVVPWSDIFEVLRTETNLIPMWAEELLSRLKPVAQAVECPVMEVAQTVFLLNRIAAVPATAPVITHLLLRDVEAPTEKLHAAVSDALSVLQDKNYVFKDTSEPPAQYRLLTEEEVSLAEKIERRADTVSYPRLRSVLLAWMTEYSPLLASEGNRREVKIRDERGVPLTVYYSVLQSIPDASDHADTVALRVFVTSGAADEEVDAWQATNGRSTTLEDGLVVVNLPSNFEERLRRYVATGDVLRNEARHFTELQSDHVREERELRNQLRDALDRARVIDAESKQKRGTFANGLKAFIVQEVVKRKFPKRRTLSQPLQPIDDGPKLAAFFRGEANWPLAAQDADVLGVSLDERALRDDPGAWPRAFEEAAQQVSSGTMLTGEQVIGMIASRSGAFRGTPVEAMGALLLVLATKPALQLRREGTLIRDPAEMGRVVRTKTELQHLTIRLEPPTDRDAIERLRTVHRQVTRATTTPNDAAEIVQGLAEWAQQHIGEVLQVHQFVEQSFDRVSVKTLVQRLQAASADPSSVTADPFSDPDVQREAQAFQRAWMLTLGEASALWTRFVEARRDLRSKTTWAPILQRLDDATAGTEVPSPARLKDLAERAENFQPSGTVEEHDADTPKTTDTPASTFDDFFNAFEAPDDDETHERLKALTERLDREAQGRIVVIQAGD
ncbi:hypothetical protein [Salisaeta longa]|uniref:hypothetical protein n=1 Tax=Salisaeta longa TaxID=503170 RepID=UPI00041DE660|nr:hypothetical protein [Salisaeta longa]